jgi:DNA polymerase III subunit delta
VAKEGVTYQSLMTGLAAHQLSALYLMFGEEDLLIEEGIEAVVQAALPSGGREFNLDIMRAGEADIRDVVARAASFPMMADHRVVVLRETEKVTGKDAEILLAYVEAPNPSTCFVAVAGKPDFRRKPFTTFKKSGIAVECRPLREHQLPAWIAARARQQGRELLPEAANLLCGYVGTSLRETQSELDKLFTYAGERKTLNADDVAAVVGIAKEYSIFELQRAVGERDLRKTVTILQRMLDAGENMQFILVMMTGYFLALWKLRELRRPGVAEADQAAGAKIPPFALHDYVAALRKYSDAEVERAFRLLASADERSKTTSAEPGRIMHTMFAELMTGTA